MIFEAITRVDPMTKYFSLEKRLLSLGRDISKYKSKSIPDINHAINVLESKVGNIMEADNFNSYHQNPVYVKESLTLEAFKLIKQIKEDREAAEDFVPGFTYYDASLTEGRVVGKKCFYAGEQKALWTKLDEDVRVLKVMEVLEHGSDDDFKKLYFEMADGKPFASAAKYCVEHITESSDEALTEMAKYADSRWDGKWPWQVKASRKLSRTIRENTTMIRNSLRQFRNDFSKARRALAEGEIEKSEIALKFRGVADDITSMIEKLGKTSAALMTDERDRVRTEFGDQHLAGLETLSRETITHAVDALSDLKAAIEKQVDEMVNGGVEARPEFDDPQAETPPMAPSGDDFNDDPMAAGGDLGDMDGDVPADLGPDAAAPGEEDEFSLDDELGLGDERKMR